MRRVVAPAGRRCPASQKLLEANLRGLVAIGSGIA